MDMIPRISSMKTVATSDFVRNNTEQLARQILRFLPVLPLVGVLYLFLWAAAFQSKWKAREYALPDGQLAGGTPYELFIYSSYYYPNSTSLGDNAIALVLTGDFDATKLGAVSVLSWNGTHNSVETARLTRITPHNVCRWIALQMLGSTLPNMTSMAMILGDQYHEIPFKLPVYKKHEVVTCIAPLFANEQWQYALFAAHTYKRFGSHMHMYIRSMVSPVFDLLKEYEKEGYLTMQPWLRIKLKTISEQQFNPNINIEFRNQAAAQTDCLLQYKESAEYMAFMDLDDILIPRLGRTFYDEFAYLFHAMPNVAFIHYGKENVDVKGQRNPMKFSLSQMYSSIYFNQKSETGKFVTRPVLINSTWIHWPVEWPQGMDRYDVPAHLNSITHLKYMEEDFDEPNKEKIRAPVFEPRTVAHNATNYLLTEEDIRWIQSDLERMMLKPGIAAVWRFLPAKFFYFNIILKCFNDTYYQYHYSGQVNRIKCPGPERCNFPMAPGFNCSNSFADYFSTSNNTRFNLHYTRNEHFRIENGCRP